MKPGEKIILVILGVGGMYLLKTYTTLFDAPTLTDQTFNKQTSTNIDPSTYATTLYFLFHGTNASQTKIPEVLNVSIKMHNDTNGAGPPLFLKVIDSYKTIGPGNNNLPADMENFWGTFNTGTFSQADADYYSQDFTNHL